VLRLAHKEPLIKLRNFSGKYMSKIVPTKRLFVKLA
jgi:hypothetical protein